MKKIPNEHFFAWAQEELFRSGEIRFRVKGNSMYPLLRNQQDEVSLRPYRAETLRKGDIVLFRYRNQYTLHRFIGQKNGFLLMQGDNVSGCREQCRIKDLIGIVTQIHRRKSLPLFSYKSLSPRSPKWKLIVFLWKIKCRVYEILRSLQKISL